MSLHCLENAQSAPQIRFTTLNLPGGGMMSIVSSRVEFAVDFALIVIVVLTKSAVHWLFDTDGGVEPECCCCCF